MDILVSDEWLRDFLNTGASAETIADKLSLCGPSVEKIDTIGSDKLYHIEITTNRVDSASVYGIAREAAAILPRFNIKATFNKIDTYITHKFSSQVKYLEVKVDKNLCPRFTAVLIRNVHIGKSPEWMVKRLEILGVRAINNIVDISNYIMHEIGQPVHTFDYDKILGAKMYLRESKKGEKIITLDGQEHILPGGDIVIEDGQKRLIDLAGIMGGYLSAVEENTKNVLLFVQTYNPVSIRKTSMTIAKRTEAAELFEKGLDTQLVEIGITRGIELFKEITKGQVASDILDIYENPPKPKKVSISYTDIYQKIGVQIPKNVIINLLSALGFESKWYKDLLESIVPTFRLNDISIAEDVVEEIARIYGYFNLPSELMQGKLPTHPTDSLFSFEQNLKYLLKEMGAIEVYSFSLVPKEWVNKGAFKLKNPLGSETEYLRTSLMPSLVNYANQNAGESQAFHLFEIANVYLPRKNELPEERLILAGIFSKTTFRVAKGIIENLVEELNIKYDISIEEIKGFLPNQSIIIKSDSIFLGEFGALESNALIYYEFEVSKLKKFYKEHSQYKSIPKYPPQIEDLTLILPEKTKVNDVIKSAITAVDNRITKFELTDIYKNSYTFRVEYSNPEKTLNDSEVEVIRNTLLKKIKNQFGVFQKD
ncbi:MAG: Phenylalanine-tRNA ligase beta subunit [Candidatus Woesebacteria bacterium GW2011_GWB1_38_8]|uniref:Phenylalanine--tRNA ligase beta subunit n=1 Tax=Candidatus Woesebacteria bacterium GW2011_GWB1_38_8 TaxID=1618570 RepID=A0A0G0NIZ4_9BACT|nr:MAG: Phenylalanine-tRNA ligase beta subunit [Candidatus Woesebacteria bacterium GW2011_GWB1_38_8]